MDGNGFCLCMCLKFHEIMFSNKDRSFNDIKFLPHSYNVVLLGHSHNLICIAIVMLQRVIKGVAKSHHSSSHFHRSTQVPL